MKIPRKEREKPEEGKNARQAKVRMGLPGSSRITCSSEEAWGNHTGTVSESLPILTGKDVYDRDGYANPD